MSDTVDKIKEKLSIVDVVQPYVKLTRAGKNYKGLSPFTKERTPSFFVSVDRGLYHCFSTGKGGDMFTFIEELEGVDFRGALKILADKAGVPLVEEKPGERDMRERLYAAVAEANAFFVATLKERANAHAYLEGRGLTDETIEEWSLGYAAKEWQALHGFLIQKGFTDMELEQAGLIKQQEVEGGSLKVEETSSSNLQASSSPAPLARAYDRFRGRIMFPIRDITGRLIAFSGRIFEDDEKNPQAKYLNSPETPLFDKSRVLYGLDRAREGIRGLGAALLVEGQLDLLMAHQAGYRNAIATSGTAFTAGHADIIKRYTNNLLIAYDGDRAGIAAAGRAASIALQKGMDVKIAKLPPEKDPADIILENKDLFKAAVKDAVHVVDFYLAHIADAKYDARTFRLEVSRTVLPYIALVQNRIDQAHFINRVATALGVPEDAVRAELKKVQSSEFRVQGEKPNSPLRPLNSELTRTEPFLSRADVIERLVFGFVLLFRERNDEEGARAAEAILKEAGAWNRLNAFLAANDKSAAALFEADFFLEEHADAALQAEAIKEVYAALLKESRHEHYREVLASLRAAEAANDALRIEELMRELSGLASALK